MIDNLSEAEFAKVLHAHVSPTAPIDSEEHLFGRKQQMNLVQQALYAPGRSIFIYGDRGVGKTSLAQTVAFSHQTVRRNPVLLACEPHTSFADVMNNAVDALRSDKALTSSTTSFSVKLGVKIFNIETGGTRQTTAPIQTPILNLNDLVAALFEIASIRKESSVVVIDEFDRITSDEERAHFADFIKQVGDQKLPFHFIFCGVSDSLEKLLGSHDSCYRYLEGIKLENLRYEARYEIIDNIAKALHCQLTDPFRHRIAAISDGFPHYIHRMCEQLFWQMFRDRVVCVTPTPAHYREAVTQSILGIEQHLKTSYDLATMREGNGYEQVLWAVADHNDLIRKTEDIYQSYLKVMQASDGSDETLDRGTAVARLNALKSTSCDKILTSNRRGFYQFRENIIRGYVRLRAEEQGCELAFDYAAASAANSSTTWRPRSSKRRFGTRPEDKRKLDPGH